MRTRSVLRAWPISSPDAMVSIASKRLRLACRQDKVLSSDEVVARAIRYGVDVAGSPELAAPLLYGPVAARELPELFPELPEGVFQAIDRHTVGAYDMAPLDMVVFVAVPSRARPPW